MGLHPAGNSGDVQARGATSLLVMKFENGKVAHEHVWWGQAPLLVQVGLLDPANLPVAGVEQARNLGRVAERHEDQSTARGIG